jgi:hypothetical protein
MLGKLMRQTVVLVAMVALVAGGLPADPMRAAAHGPEADVCAAERAPILERQRQYQALKRSRIAKSVGEGLKKGALFFAGAMASRYAGGGGGGGGGGFGSLASGLTGGLPFGGLSFGGGKPSHPTPGPAPGGGGLGGILTGSVLAEASGYSIPGVTMGARGSGQSGLSGDTKAIAAVAVIVAIAGTVEAYVRLKEAEANGDRARMARSIEDDAGRQIPVSRAIAQEEAALSNCLQRQITDVNAHLASASNTSGRRNDAQRASLIKAIKRDVDLTEDVCDQQATLAKTYTQGRAMTEGRSESDVLGGQAPSYAPAASTERLRMPSDAKVQKVSTKPEPPPPPSYSASRATVVRAAPSAKAKVLANLPAGAPVQVKDLTGETWVKVETDSGVGYVLASAIEVSDGTASSAASAGGGRLAAATNVREHNRAVIQAKDQGPNRLKSLLTGIETT